MYQVITVDAVQWAKDYKTAGGPLFHALLSDPPYHLTSIVKRFGEKDSRPAAAGVYGRSSAGFMGKRWDGGDIAFRPETWRAFYDILHAGAFGMAFAGSRGWHRQAVAIEDAGFIIHPTIFLWAFGSGFPKATRLDGQIDRDAGAKREVVGIKTKHTPIIRSSDNQNHRPWHDTKRNPAGMIEWEYTAPATPLAEQWAGHRYGLQALKPAVEPIIVFQKPYPAGRPVDSITATGAGALNIDWGRIATDDEIMRNHGETSMYGGLKMKTHKVTGSYSLPAAGRWPANFILQHLPDCNGTCAAGCPVEEIGRQSGESEEKRSKKKCYSGAGGNGIYGDFADRDFSPSYPDAGTAARFFFNSDYVAEKLEQSAGVFYTAKASRSERDAGLGDMPAIQPVYNGKNEESAGRAAGSVEDKFSTSPRRNSHPTLKPLSLTTHLAGLLLPPPEYEPRLLIPFAGAGSEMVGALMAGWHTVIGLEREAEYCEIAGRRLEFWKDKPAGYRVKLPKRDKQPCANCGGLGVKFSETFDEWITKTGNYGGTHEEWVKLSAGRHTCPDCGATGETTAKPPAAIWQSRLF